MYMSQQEISDTLKPIAEQIARHLGNQWTVNVLHPGSDYPPHWVITNGTMRLTLDMDLSKHPQQRVTVSGTVPNRDPNNSWHIGCGCEIGVNLARGAEAIAREITRRLLPEYAVKLAEATEQRNAAADYMTRRRAAMREFMDILGVSDHERERFEKNPDHESFSLYKGPGYGDVQVYPDSATLHLRSIPLGLARQIARVYADYKAKTQEAK